MSEPGENRPPQFERDETAFVVKLTDLGSSRFSLQHPLDVVVREADGQFIVTEVETGSYSNQDTLAVAIEDLRDVLVSRREILGNSDLLAPGAQFVAENWREILTEQSSKPQS